MKTLLIRQLGMAEYSACYARQKEFTRSRNPLSMDEVWCLQHPPVYTLGLAGKIEHILDPGTVPIEKTDRGGQVTYHGPGQLVMYPLLDLKRAGISIRQYVSLLEQSVIDLLEESGVEADRQDKAPGVYVGQKKIAALGIRVRNGCCYHGLSLNVNLDLTPFQGINPCGYPWLEVTRLSDLGILMDVEEAGLKLVPHIARHLGVDNYDLCEYPAGIHTGQTRHEVA